MELYVLVSCIGIVNCILEEELYILLDDVIVELARHKTLENAAK